MAVGRTLVALVLVFATLKCSDAYQFAGQQGQPAKISRQQEATKEVKPEKQTDEVKPQQDSPKKPERQERPLDLVLFINDVRSAPPEFATDLLIRIAESKKIADADWKRELVEEAFRLAPSVQEQTKRVALGSSPTDTRSGFLAQSFDLKLDALSLRCRAVNAMLAIDKQKARELFGEIPRVQLQPLNCEDALVYDVSDFYTTLKKIAETSFTQKEIKSNEPVRLIESYVDQMTSPVEVAPALELVASTNTTHYQREEFVYAFSKALSNISGDDRSFTKSLYYVDKGIKNLITQCLQLGVSIDELLKAYRTYLVRHFSAARCADNSSIFPNQSGVISDFNNELRLKSPKNILAISSDDCKPLRIDGTVRTYMHWQTPKSSVLLTEIKKLRFGSGDNPSIAGTEQLTTAERDTLDWRAKLDDFLKDLADWKKEDEETEEDYFHQKCILFRALIQLIPRETLREDVIRSYVQFLNSFDLNRGSRIEWFWQAKFLLKDSPFFDSLKDSGPRYVVKSSDMLPIVETTKNPVLYLYAQAEKLLSGPSPSK